MTKLLVRTMTVFFGLVALGSAAKGQTPDQVVVTIPYNFVVDGQSLPAGDYKISRLSDLNGRELVIAGMQNRDSAMVFSKDAERASGAPHLTFLVLGGQHLLSKIETGDHIFSIPVRPSAVQEEASEGHSDPSLARSGASRSK